jgi:hypothetical protein
MGGVGARVAKTGRLRQANPDGNSSQLGENHPLHIRTQWPCGFFCVCKMTLRQRMRQRQRQTERSNAILVRSGLPSSCHYVSPCHVTSWL